MFTVWAKSVSGRIKSDPRISPDLTYNTFPFPDSTKRRTHIEVAAQSVLTARAEYPDDSLATLYDPLLIPPELSRAHNKLDRVVDSAYGASVFRTDAQRLKALFARYSLLTTGGAS